MNCWNNLPVHFSLFFNPKFPDMLSKEQTLLLFEFCEKKHVRYYDVQVELVDHLATAIESKMKEGPAKTFEKALDEVYKGFGLFGFSHIVMEKEQAVMLKQRAKFYQLLRHQFRWPSVVLVLLITIVTERLIYFSGATGWQFSIALVFLSGFILSLYCGISLSGLRKKLRKKLVIASFLYSAGWVYVPLYFFMFSLDKMESAGWVAVMQNDWIRPLLGLLIAVYIVISIAHYRIYRDVVSEIKTGFPELI